MAFGSKKQSEEKPEEANTSEQQEDNKLGFLEPTKNARKDSLNDPYQEEMIKKAAYQYTLKTLNALKIVSPIITALMKNPGVDAKSEEISASFKHLIKEISNASGMACEKINVDPSKEKNFWIRNVLEKSLAEVIKDQWITSGKTDISKIVELLDSVIEFGEQVSEKNDYEYLDQESTVKVAIIKAIMPVIGEATSNFDLYRKLENDLEQISEKLFEKSVEAVMKLSDKYAESPERSKLFYIVMQEAGQLYANAWNAEGKRVREIMNAYSPDKLQKALDRYKNSEGLPLDKVNHEFDKYFDKMVVITEKLVSSPKSGIDKKIKNKV